MKLKNITIAVFVLIAALATFSIINIGSIAGHASEGKGARAIEGSWEVRLTTQAGNDLIEFDELMTFTAGGGIVESNNYPFNLSQPFPLVAGPGHGSWRFAGARQFPFTFVKLLYTPAGDAAGTLRVTGIISYSPENDTWSGPGNVEICPIGAPQCFPSGVTNAVATRIVAGE